MREGEVSERRELSARELLDNYLSLGREVRPLSLMTEFVQRNLSNADYDELVPLLEQRALSNLNALESTRLVLRGDTVNPNEDPVKMFEGKVVGGVRTRNVKLPDNRELLLGLLVAEVTKRRTLARVYERKNAQAGRITKPLVVYGFTRFKSSSDDSFDFNDYFEGHADDIGVRFGSAGAIELPATSKWEKNQSVEDLKYFPEVPPALIKGEDTRTTSVGRERVEKWSIMADYQHSSEFSFMLINSRTYFNTLLAVDKILMDLDNFYRKEPNSKDYIAG